VAAWLLSSRAKLTYDINQKIYIMSIAKVRLFLNMKWEYRDRTIELFLVGIHHPNYPYKIWEEAKTIWKVVIDNETPVTRTGDRDEVLAEQKGYIDWVIAGADVNELF
jgi:hypothetical protein